MGKGVILAKISITTHSAEYVCLLGVPFGAEMRKLDPFEPDLVNTSGGKQLFYLYMSISENCLPQFSLIFMFYTLSGAMALRREPLANT